MNTNEQILEKRSNSIRSTISREVGNSTMDLINELLEVERELTLLENK